MRPLMRWECQDPLRVLIAREAAELKQSCSGCAQAKAVVSPFGDTVMRCLKGRPYGKKCSQYARSES